MVGSGKPLGVIIAGGQSRRFNNNFQDEICRRDKFLMPFGPTTLLGHIITRATQQIPDLILNVNGDQQRIMSYGLDVVADDVPDTGPLGGILAAMQEAAKRGYSHIITFSGDSPFFPDDYVARLVEAGGKDVNIIVVASSGDKIHPVMGFFPVSCRHDLKTSIARGDRRVMWWVRRHAYKKIIWDQQNPDPFFNINRPRDLEKARQYLC